MSTTYMREGTMYLRWFDDDKGLPVPERIGEGVKRYREKWEREPNVCICNEGQVVEVVGLSVRGSQIVEVNNFLIGYEAPEGVQRGLPSGIVEEGYDYQLEVPKRHREGRKNGEVVAYVEAEAERGGALDAAGGGVQGVGDRGDEGVPGTKGGRRAGGKGKGAGGGGLRGEGLGCVVLAEAVPRAKAPFELRVYDPLFEILVVCECDPEANWARSWYPRRDGSQFDFVCGNPACGKAYRIRLQANYSVLEAEKGWIEL